MGPPAQPLWLAPAEAHVGVSAPFPRRWQGLPFACQCWNWWKMWWMWWKASAPTPCPPAVAMARGPHPLLQAYGNGQDSQRSGVAVCKLSAECCYADLVYIAHAFSWVKGSMSE